MICLILVSVIKKVDLPTTPMSIPHLSMRVDSFLVTEDCSTHELTTVAFEQAFAD
jgi:hypothetical protein